MRAFGLFTAAVRNWGENCTHSDECFDDRMVCEADGVDNVFRCFCNRSWQFFRFHAWNGSTMGCVQIYSVEYIMNETVRVHDNAGNLSKLQDLMFRGPVYSIFFMMSVISLCAISVLIYCIYVRVKDNRLKHIVVHMDKNHEHNKKLRLLQTQQSTSQC